MITIQLMNRRTQALAMAALVENGKFLEALDDGGGIGRNSSGHLRRYERRRDAPCDRQIVASSSRR